MWLTWPRSRAAATSSSSPTIAATAIRKATPSGAYGSPNYVVDVLNALASMEHYPDADPNRIGMWGHSMGGYITLRSMVITNTIKAGVIWGGVVGPYPNLFMRPTATPTPEGATPRPTSTRAPGFGRRWNSELVRLYGSPEENPAFWESISANAFLDQLSGPIQLHHGTADTSVPLLASETLYQEMMDAQEPVELYTYQGDNHNISNNFSSGDAAFHRILRPTREELCHRKADLPLDESKPADRKLGRPCWSPQFFKRAANRLASIAMNLQ